MLSGWLRLPLLQSALPFARERWDAAEAVLLLLLLLLLERPAVWGVLDALVQAAEEAEAAAKGAVLQEAGCGAT